MAFTKLHHVGMMVRSLEEARHLFVDAFGLAVDEKRSPLPNGRHVPFDNVNILDIPVGETEIEVNMPNDPTRGPGVSWPSGEAWGRCTTSVSTPRTS